MHAHNSAGSTARPGSVFCRHAEVRRPRRLGLEDALVRNARGGLRLPKVAGDAEDATTTIFFFGTQQGGSVQANIDRWMSQMEQPDGKASKDVAKTSALTANGIKISVVDVTGTYVAETAPGSGVKLNKPGFRQLAAVVETPGGNYYVKLTGPAKTVTKWEASYMALLKSLKYE
jgi:hypothetical protein